MSKITVKIQLNEVLPKVESEAEFRIRRAVVLTLRDQVNDQYSSFFEDSYIGLFKPPLSNEITPAISWIFGVCSLILNKGKTDAGEKTAAQALSIWWLANYCIGASPADGVKAKMQLLRKEAGREGKLEPLKQIVVMNLACDFARGLVKQFDDPIKCSRFIVEFLETINRIQTALKTNFNFEAVALPLKHDAGLKYL